MKNLCDFYINRNSKIFTASTFPHTMTSNTMMWSGEFHNLFWIHNNSDEWVDPANEYDRDTSIVKNKDISLIKFDEIQNFPWIWNVLETYGYRARAVQLPIVLPPYSYKAVEETKDWFPYAQKALYNNLRDKERITMNALKDMKDDKLDFYCTSFPQPDKLMHALAERHLTQQFVLDELQYLDQVAKKIDSYCNKHNITFCIFGDHGAPNPDGDNLGYHWKQKIAVVRHRKNSVIISNHKGDTPGYTDEMYPWILKFFDIKNVDKKIVTKDETINLSEKDEQVVKDRLQKLGYL